MGGREEQAWRTLADHTQQAAEEIRPGPLLVGNCGFSHTSSAPDVNFPANLRAEELK